MKNTQEKYYELQKYLRSLEGVAVAFSSGVDSTFLLKVAHDVLGDRAIAVTAGSCSFPERELKEAVAFTKKNGIIHEIVESEELSIEGFSENPVNRCYLCKYELFSKIKDIAYKNGIKEVVEGSNIDDLGDYRPGLAAIEELDIKSPLRHAGLTKNEIRRLSKELSLPTWAKQSFACLSSRFPYGQKITTEKLRMVDEAEQLLMDMGFHQIRVRHHETLARIEIGEEQFSKIMEKENRDLIYARFKEIGFTYVSLDLAGYRTGSMNETIK
ncbi:MAG: ATP-dependent sacrificial sulfur transferase LarE [Eubacteriales bacterium]|nr:ATP-dependent sacrificial sulfur transferase LarE [Eubacteriales bacterium]MDD3199582.1 ATP-dependent sacrificial sulfur transferase LarE [Eubacteriales bacterium]MDD4122641.1 ATP-dependent sacrificial sulfur transferase LarE [Eubacteriales bacterium]MDD4629294.1 ATP-dependent sacrificial sulfur transferase LarE [Eubacteriales bacterium]